MKQAIIDMGSNSMRLTVYKIDEKDFTILFKDKVVAGLAGYVEDGNLTEEGIACASRGLLTFRTTLDSLEIAKVSVFATASLRNISNTRETLSRLRKETGFDIEVLSGEEEARLGYTGAMRELEITSGAFIDIGGASTEIVTFDKGIAINSRSFGIGSLSLYRTHVKKILPNKEARKKIRHHIEETLDFPFEPRTHLICVGGTARAALKLAKHLGSKPSDSSSISSAELDKLVDFLSEADRPAIDLILKQEPHRIHTMLPGLMILHYLCRAFHATEIVVSNYGVREGYLCQKVL